MHEPAAPDTTDEPRDGEGAANNFASAAWALFLIGIALFLILRTV